MSTNRHFRSITFHMKRLFSIARLIIALVVCVLPLQIVSARGEPDFAVIDAYLQQQMKVNHIPGVALAITRQDQIVHLAGFGVADPSGR
jgi:hypothetical protein